MRYNKSETRIINNAIKMAEEVKKYHERTQSWDIPEHLIVDGCKVGKWWIEINKRIREGSIPDEVVHLMIDNKIDCGIRPLYQEEWYQMGKYRLRIQGRSMFFSGRSRRAYGAVGTGRNE